MCQHLRHDTAIALATALLEIIGNCLRDEERKDAFDEFFTACMGALECYDTLKRCNDNRLAPSRN
jgi:hypothetical protein